jgi:biopolymer transport protein TolR
MMAARKSKRRPIADINVVPYIDVMLVLLVVFMVTAPLLVQGVKVQLPQASAAPLEQQDEDPLIISIESNGRYYINLGDSDNQRRQQPLAKIIEKVVKILQRQPQTPILVRGDADVAYGRIVELMAQLQASGAASVGLVTEPGSPPVR